MYKSKMCEPRWVGHVVGHLVSKCLSQVQLGVLPSSNLDTCTLKKPLRLAIYPTRAHSSRTMISLWLNVLRIHCEKPPKKQKQKFQLVQGASRTEKGRPRSSDLFLFCFVCFHFQFRSDLLQIMTSFFNFLGPQGQQINAKKV